MKNSNTRTALACSLLRIFYSKDELNGRCLHELDQDVIEAIPGMYSCTICIHITNAPVKVNPKPPTPGYRWGLVLIACKKRQIPHHVGQEIAENAPTPEATEDSLDESVVE